FTRLMSWSCWAPARFAHGLTCAAHGNTAPFQSAIPESPNRSPPMSNENHSSLPPEPSDRKALFSAIGWVGVIFIFVLIVLIVYVPNRDRLPGRNYDEERLAIRAEVDATQENKVSRYAWENQAEGIVR